MNAMNPPLPPTACPDWPDRLRKGQLPLSLNRLPLRTKAAKRISWIFRQLKMPDLDGQPEIGSIMETNHWLDTVGKALFGGSEIREAMILVGKKNNKTSGGALLYLAAFLGNKVPNQSFTILAPTVGIANFAFDQIKSALKADPEIDEKTHTRAHIKEIEHLETGSKIAVKPASLDALTGLKGSVFVDELHVWGNMRDGQKLRQQLRGALAASKTARALYITTQSDSEPAGIFRNMLDYARKVRDGEILDPAFLPVLFEPWPGSDPWEDETVWPHLLPSYPHIADRNFYRAAIAEANNSGTSAIAEAKSQYFNVEIGTGEAGEGWIVAENFNLLTEAFGLDELIEMSDRLSIGIDLGGAADLAALAVLGVGPDKIWRVWIRCWLTKEGLKQNIRNESRFEEYQSEGDLRIVKPGEDVNQMLSICEEIRETGKLVGVGVDPAGAADLADALEAAGFEMEKDLHGVGQSAFRLAPAVRTLERKAERGTVQFSRQRLMGWCLKNVILKQKGNAPSIEKQFARDRIDPVMAVLDAAIVEIHHREDVVDVGAMIG